MAPFGFPFNLPAKSIYWSAICQFNVQTIALTIGVSLITFNGYFIGRNSTTTGPQNWLYMLSDLYHSDDRIGGSNISIGGALIFDVCADRYLQEKLLPCSLLGYFCEREIIYDICAHIP